ncbi:hypothetical protein DM860_003873 [Cuscuta australis]|uniref:Uncharacterized protein n=1 Tax=Cuscuta australis TaxID=267555 RepID=A0A328CXF5_9ASTE|nr:hypothetical protein DM860_003873 [Cuscuta australis]
MSSTVSIKTLLAASGGDTVKLFDLSLEPRDTCILSYTPTPGFQVNSVKWNHTNLVVASAGDDKKISLWRKNGQSIGTIPAAGSDCGDSIEESIATINFNNKGSRYLCSGGSGQIVRIWDLQRKRCIKWLKGHSGTITGATYNCKDEHLASISLNGDLMLHNLASGARAAELKDPHGQVLRVIDYSRTSRHLLVTAGDDGSIHLWDTTGRTPKASWLKQHLAPTTGISFSPSNDKIITSVGLDKKLYTFDVGSRRPAFFIPYEAPFSSLAYTDDGLTLAAGTSSGQIALYDIRGKLQPLTVQRAYGHSEAVTSLCWQRSKPIVVNENNCTPDIALLGTAVEDSVLMPDPLPALTSSALSTSTAVSNSRNPGRSGPSVDPLPFLPGGSVPASSSRFTPEESPVRNDSWKGGGALGRLHAPRYNIKDDMEVFSPLVDVQPMTPSIDKLWDEHGIVKNDSEKSTSFSFPSARRFPLLDEGGTDNPSAFDWKSSSVSNKDDIRSLSHLPSAAPIVSSQPDASLSITPPEAWGGGERFSDRAHLRQSRFAVPTPSSLASGTIFSALQNTSSSLSSLSLDSLRVREISKEVTSSSEAPENVPSSSAPFFFATRGLTGQGSLDSLGPTLLSIPRKVSSYAERISSISDGTLSVGSPKIKKTGAETRDELLQSLLSRPDVSSSPKATSVFQSMNVPLKNNVSLPDSQQQQQGSSFSLQLYQRSLEEALEAALKPVLAAIRDLHIDHLRESHMRDVRMAELEGEIKALRENQAEHLRQYQLISKENQELRQHLF